MSAAVLETDGTAIEGVVQSLEAAWNAADGKAFGAPFAVDADFVTIRAEHYVGRDAIAAGHAAIFRTIYGGSTIRFVVEASRFVRSDVAVAHVRSLLNAPTGPLAGQHAALFSIVLTRDCAGWCIVSLHNTLAPADPKHREHVNV
jgi:uncharacterized protein (TIGR02246 family)